MRTDRTHDRVEPGQAEETYASGIFARAASLGPVGLAERDEIGRVGNTRAIVGNGDDAGILEMLGGHPYACRACTARVLEQLVEDVAERSVEDTGDFGDRLGRSPGTQCRRKCHGRMSFGDHAPADVHMVRR